VRRGAPSHTLHRRAAAPLSSVFVVSLVLPAPAGVYQLVMYFGLAQAAAAGPAHDLLQRFVGGGAAFRNARFKLFPLVSEGPWIVRKAIGSRPALLGRALKQRFSATACGEGGARLPLFHVVADCNSSPAAGRAVTLAKSYARSLVVDLAFAVEPQAEAELPERLLGAVRLHHLSLDEVPFFDPARASPAESRRAPSDEGAHLVE